MSPRVEDRLALVTAFVLSAVIAMCCVLLRGPDGPTPYWFPQARIRIVYACPQGYVCFPAKDESRHVNTGLLPSRLVQTTAYLRPVDIPPAVQAQDNRKKKSSKR